MREIIFRGKRKDNGEWVEGNFVKGCVEDFAYIVEFGNKELCRNYVEVIPESVSEFTGLTDKNGTKVFEGDIVKTKVTENKYTHTRKYEGIYTVKYHDKNCYFYLAKQGNNLLFDGNWDYFLSNIEVIGNIHDNPELLGGE